MSISRKKQMAWTALATSALLLIGAVTLFSQKEETVSLRTESLIQPPPEVETETPLSTVETNTATTAWERPSLQPAVENPLTPEEQTALDEAEAITQEMTYFLDDGDDLKAIETARTLLRHPNREVRFIVYQALDWVGLPAALDMAGMIDDEDDEIRNMARDSFWNMLQEMEKPDVQRDLLASALTSSDPEMRESVLDELIYIPDGLAFELLANSMNDANESIAELAKENVEFISGETFDSQEEAMNWFAENKQDLDLGEAPPAKPEAPTMSFRQRLQERAKQK